MIAAEQFGGVHIGRRHHRLAERHRIGQRPRGRLLGAGIRRHVDVRRLDQVEQFVGLEKGVDPADMRVDAERGGEPLQPFAIGLAFACQKIGMCRARDAIKDAGTIRDDRRKRLNHHLDPLARREQPEGQHHLPAVESELGFEPERAAEGPVGHAVRDEDDLIRVGAIHRPQQIARPFGHHDQLARTRDQTLHHPPLIGIGLVEDGVERDDQRRAHPVEEFEDHVAGKAAEQPEFVLEPDDIGAARLDPPRRIDKARRIAFGNGGADHGVERDRRLRRRHRIDVDGKVGNGRLERRVNVSGKGRDAAAPRQISPDQRQSDRRLDLGSQGRVCLTAFFEGYAVRGFVHRKIPSKMKRQKASPG